MVDRVEIVSLPALQFKRRATRMADGLLQLLRESDWGVFELLAGHDERNRRRILRSHRDVPFRGDAKYEEDERVLRDALDAALDRLCLIELAIEARLLQPSDLPSSDSLVTLFGSSAFARYITSYLFFGVAFVAGRTLGPESYRVGPPQKPVPAGNGRGALNRDSSEERRFEINDLPLPLPPPPPLEAHSGIEESIAHWLDFQNSDEDILTALRFIDNYGESDQQRNELEARTAVIDSIECGWKEDYERWLAGLGGRPERESYFRHITIGLRAFVRQRVKFYNELEGPKRIESWRVCGRLTDGVAKNPYSARFGVLDLYWLARLLRAELSSVGVVTYAGESWISLLAERARQDGESQDTITAIEEAEPVLRAVFDYACHLVQNAISIACDEREHAHAPETFLKWPGETVIWQRAYDEELAELAVQRKRRGFGESAEFAPEPLTPVNERASVGWSRRVRTGEHLENLIGLSLSGGGIRSATFNLGVLQRLQELDLLRGVDYLSTVSGGGYIGAWLLGNVRRTHYWLSQLTDWSDSIEHLRRYSNYLAPRTGLMSVDTWTMWASWARNAFLVQITALAWLWAILVAGRIGEAIFTWNQFRVLATFPWNLVLAPLIMILTISVCASLQSQFRHLKQWHVLAFAVTPAWLGAFVTAAMLWADRPQMPQPFSEVLSEAWQRWDSPLFIMFASLWVLAAISIDAKTPWRVVFGFFTAAGSIVVVYLCFCGVRYLFGNWNADRHTWNAYVLGPPLVLFAMTLPIVAVIGLIGNQSQDWRREWWTRLGSWIGISGVGFLAISVTSVFAPLLAFVAFDNWGSWQWSTLLGWIATVIGGLLSGNSDRTRGAEGRSWTTWALEWFSKIAAFVFIVGAVFFASTALHLLLVAVVSDVTPIPRDYWSQLRLVHTEDYWAALAALLALGLIFSWRFEINIFGLNQFYRNRLVRCYLGATRWRTGLRKPHSFTGFDEGDELLLSDFSNRARSSQPYRGPFPIVNGSLNLGGSSDLGLHSRHSASFTFTPLRAGADRKAVGYSPVVGEKRFAGGLDLGQVVSVSGAAASPNMGYSTSPLVAFLLTMFNVRLAWWFPNPGRRWWDRSKLPLSTWYLMKEMFGMADETNRFINISDGGHFENLGIYELVRRRCRVIIACDAECDSKLTFGSLGNVIRLCETDLRARIDIDVESIRRHRDSGVSQAHCAIGRITYSNGSRGHLIYLKSSLTGDEEVSIEQYQSSHPEFPHETTGDQFFAEDQFESYRRLGHHIAKMTFRDVERDESLLEMVNKLADIWAPATVAGNAFADQTRALDDIWERFRSTTTLQPLLNELMSNRASPAATPTEEQLVICMELFQFMENVYLGLRLADFWNHPDNRGWVVLFTTWAKSGTLRGAWKQTRTTFSIGFVYFCEHRLGL
jgi:hypothetical protein